MKYILELEDEPNKEYFGEGNYYRCKQIPYWSISESMRNRLEPYDEADDTENSSEKPNNSTISILEQVEPQTEQWHYDEKDNTWYPYQHKSCATCKHAFGNWDGESNNCGRCCGADRRFYEPIEDEQTERSSE